VTRVNLLRSVPDARANAGAPDRRRGALAGSVILILTACALASWTWALHREGARLDRELARGGHELSRLRRVIADAAAMSEASQDLQRRIDAIGALRQAQRAPVRILEAVGSALPGDCWLTVVVEEPANTMRIEGRAPALSSLLEMVEHLERSVIFAHVEVLDSHARNDDPDGNAIGFSVKATVRAVSGVVPPSDASAAPHTPANGP
jgi:Tfp pilus assembly protein PilN